MLTDWLDILNQTATICPLPTFKRIQDERGLQRSVTLRIYACWTYLNFPRQEPERMRGAAARPSSFLGFDAEALNPSSGTQRSAFFPWDNAAGTSSTAGAAFSRPNDSDRVSIENADVRIRGPRSSHSGAGSRRSSIIPSQLGSAAGISLRLSPGAPGSYIGSAIAGDDFQFDGGYYTAHYTQIAYKSNAPVPNEGPAATAQDTQETENNFVTLERTSYNFLE